MYRTSERTSLSRKMAELEDRWRKSQEDRYMLELKFKEVLKGLANKNEGAKLLRIREKYHRFLENEGSRNQRNDQIVRTLDKIESQANILAAKTERLRLLKLHYEAYMKRMYPTWKISENEEEYMPSKKKEAFYPTSNKQRREIVSPSSQKRGESISRKLTYQNSPYVNKFNSSNHVLEERKPSSLPLSNAGSPDNPSRQYNGENSRILDLNREFSNVNIEPTRRNGNSRDLSVEQEENTSKDLLNLSLSDGNPVNDTTNPLELRTSDEHNRSKSPKNAIFRDRSCANVDPEPFIDKHDNNSVASVRGSASNKEPAHVGDGKDSDFDNTSDVKRFDVSSKKENFKSPPKEDGEEVKPSVVITQPTPDIGMSSSEEEFERRGKHRSPSPHEISEVSEVERLEGDVGKEKISPDEEQSPRAFLGDNVEGPYQFSSSDADYDELENQLAAVVERRGSDEIIPKVSDDIVSESKPDVDQQDTEQQETYGPVGKEASDLVPKTREDELYEDVIDKRRLENNIEITKIQENVEESADDNNEGHVKQEEENPNLITPKDRKIKSFDSERDYEAGSSSMDVNSEILDEDHNMNADGIVHLVEESITEANESKNSDVEEENPPPHSERQRIDELVQLENEETNDYYPIEVSPSAEEREVHEYEEDVDERNYPESEETRNEQDFGNNDLEDTADRGEGKANRNTQSDDEVKDVNPEYFPEGQPPNERYTEENVSEDYAREMEGNAESKNMREVQEYNTGDVQQGLQKEEEWGADDIKDKQTNREENVVDEYTRQEEDDEYERGDGEQIIENRRNYEEEDQQQEIEEAEFNKQDVSYHEQELNAQYTEEENVYERQDYEVSGNEGDQIQREDEWMNMEEGEDIAPEKKEHEMYETEEQVNEELGRLATSEMPEEPNNNDAENEQQGVNYEDNIEEVGQYEKKVEEQESDRHGDYSGHETEREESHQYHHEENREEHDIQPYVEEKDGSRNVEGQREMEEVAVGSSGHVGDEYLNQEMENREERLEERKEEDQIYDKNVQESPELVNEGHANELEETHTLSPENMEHRQDVVTPESNISDNAETENQSSDNILAEEIKHEKEEVEIPHVEEEKPVVEEIKSATNVVVKEVKKENIVHKEKKVNDAAATSSLSVEKHERTTKESAPTNNRQSARQLGKKEYDPHKVEKLKSTIRKFQLKKDNKPDKIGRKGTDSRK